MGSEGVQKGVQKGVQIGEGPRFVPTTKSMKVNNNNGLLSCIFFLQTK